MAGESKVNFLPLVITINSTTSSSIVTIIMLHSGHIAPIHVCKDQNSYLSFFTA